MLLAEVRRRASRELVEIIIEYMMSTHHEH